jgi:hypothetical protein
MHAASLRRIVLGVEIFSGNVTRRSVWIYSLTRAGKTNVGGAMY